MTGGEVVHEVLVRAGVTHVFGVVSVHNLPIYDAIERGGRITPVAMRHEQAAVHAADGYARATGRLGVAVTSTGPGAANGLPGLYEAGFASSPVLMITGQADTPNFGKGRGFVHEADNQAAMLAAVCRRVETVRMRQQIAPGVDARDRGHPDRPPAAGQHRDPDRPAVRRPRGHARGAGAGGRAGRGAAGRRGGRRRRGAAGRRGAPAHRGRRRRTAQRRGAASGRCIRGTARAGRTARRTGVAERQRPRRPVRRPPPVPRATWSTTRRFARCARRRTWCWRWARACRWVPRRATTRR